MVELHRGAAGTSVSVHRLVQATQRHIVMAKGQVEACRLRLLLIELFERELPITSGQLPQHRYFQAYVVGGRQWRVVGVQEWS